MPVTFPLAPSVLAACTPSEASTPDEPMLNAVRFRVPLFEAKRSVPVSSAATAFVAVPPLANGEPAAAVSVVAAPLPLIANDPTRLPVRSATTYRPVAVRTPFTPPVRPETNGLPATAVGIPADVVNARRPDPKFDTNSRPELSVAYPT